MNPPMAGGPIAARQVELGSLRPDHRAAVRSLLNETGVFHAFEIDTALEVIDAYFAHPDVDYSALGALTDDDRLVGFACWGPTPCTAGTHDLYWIAVSPGSQNAGVGTKLLSEVERRLTGAGARLVLIETSSLPRYAATRAFYERRGYAQVARVPDFYADGDDRLIFVKRLATPR